jgi:hypothetical protein
MVCYFPLGPVHIHITYIGLYIYNLYRPVHICLYTWYICIHTSFPQWRKLLTWPVMVS